MAARLQAQDADDLAVISAMLQDAAVRVGDIAFLPKRRRFAFGGSRFRWEEAGASGRPVRTGFGAHIDNVLSVASRGIAQDRPDDVLVLLAVTAAPLPAAAGAAGAADEAADGTAGAPDGTATDPGRDGTGAADLAVTLIFAGGGAITLRVECIDMSLADLGTSYPTRLKPDHDLAGGGAGE